jgi:hypothetical protein
LLTTAIVATNHATVLFRNVEARLHGFVVGNTLGIATLHNAYDFVGEMHLALFYNIKILDDRKVYVRRHYS